MCVSLLCLRFFGVGWKPCANHAVPCMGSLIASMAPCLCVSNKASPVGVLSLLSSGIHLALRQSRRLDLVPWAKHWLLWASNQDQMPV